MHDHYGHHDAFESLNKEQLKTFLKFRIDFLQEELDEMKAAYERSDIDSPEDVVDALIDLCVVAIGTLDAFEVDGHKAWYEVLRANMAKRSGVNHTRPNPLGLPDLIKPKDWQAPSHYGNHGKLTEVFK
jgi:predicted HAD superfamily Cof-like phosphohydrolase